LETGALPVELRPFGRAHDTGVRRPSLGVLFSLLAAGFLAVAVYAALTGGAAWVIAVAAAALAAWLGELAYRSLRP
jgi:hypothetical protein